MKKRRILCLALCLLLVLPVAAQAADADGGIVKTGECNTLDAVKAFFSSVEGVENAEAALLYEVTTDTLVYAKNADTPMYPSSLTKIMTALVVLEQSNLQDAVTVKQEVLNSIPAGSAIAELKADEVLTVKDLLYSMMVDSANDSAAVLADYAAGSQEAFVKLMNDRADSIGCTNTNFVNVHGLYNEAHVSTARDIAKIINEAIQDERFIEIFGTAYYTMPATNKREEHTLISSNFLMTQRDVQVYYDSRVTGGRTGITPSGLRCIATTAQSNDLQMICVILGSQSTTEEDSTAIKIFGGFQETSHLLDKGFNGMSARQVLFPNQALKQYKVENGDNDLIVGPQVAAMCLLPDSVTGKDLTYRYNDLSGNLTVPIAKGQKVSTLEVLYNGTCIAVADLYAMNAVKVKQSSPANTQSSKETSIVPVLLVIIAVLAVIILFLFGSRFARRARLASRRKRVRNKQRRSR